MRDKSAGTIMTNPGGIPWIWGPKTLSFLYVVCNFIAFIFPASVYEAYIPEQYNAWGDVSLLWFSSLCYLSILVGILLATMMGAPERKTYEKKYLTIYEIRSLKLIGLFVILINSYSIILILQNNYHTIYSVFIVGSSPNAIKKEFVSDGAMLGANPLLIFTSWALYHTRMAGEKSKSTISLLFLSMLLSISISLAKLARYEVIPLIIGLSVIKIYWMGVYGKSNIKIYTRLLTYIAATLCVFVAFSMLRYGAEGQRDFLSELIGYSLASFNRLSAVLDGRLQLSYGGTGVYTFNFLTNMPFIGSVLSGGLPDNSIVFQMEFWDIARGGLTMSYNWVTMYGYYYSDQGYGVYLFCAMIGIFGQISWVAFSSGKMWGVIIYPYIASSLILSFSFYWLTRPSIAALAILIVAYYSCNAIFRLAAGGSRSLPA